MTAAPRNRAHRIQGSHLLRPLQQSLALCSLDPWASTGGTGWSRGSDTAAVPRYAAAARVHPRRRSMGLVGPSRRWQLHEVHSEPGSSLGIGVVAYVGVHRVEEPVVLLQDWTSSGCRAAMAALKLPASLRKQERFALSACRRSYAISVKRAPFLLSSTRSKRRSRRMSARRAVCVMSSARRSLALSAKAPVTLGPLREVPRLLLDLEDPLREVGGIL